MIKHRFLVVSVDSSGIERSSTCIDTDMIHLIQEYRKLGMNPHSVVQLSQVHADTPIGIEK